MIYFSNPGLIDIRLVSTFGVNVKPGPSPIGHFGTGLKYAIAGVLRLGGTVTCSTGSVDDETEVFFAKTVNFRGEDVEMVHMMGKDGPIQLPFSTSLGAHWAPWMLYREFFCNAKDEGGGLPTRSWPSGPLAQTVFAINCPAVEAVQHHEYFLEGKPFALLGSVELHPSSSKKIFYKGVAVADLAKPTLFTYNILEGTSLTEDRTLHDYYIQNLLARAWANATEEHLPLLRKLLVVGDDHYEHRLDFANNYYGSGTQAFKEVMAETCCNNPGAVPAQHRKWAKAHCPDSVVIAEVPMTTEQQEMIAEAKMSLRLTLGIELAHPVVLTRDAESQTVAFAFAGKCFLTARAFATRKDLWLALLEEHLHLAHGLMDNTRPMQNTLFDLIWAAARPGMTEGAEQRFYDPLWNKGLPTLFPSQAIFDEIPF